VATLREAVIVDAVRSPIGRRAGALAGTRPDDLAAAVIASLVERTGVDPAAVEDVVLGCVTQVGEQGYNIGRVASMISGLPVEAAGTSVNRMCGSSMQAAMQAAHAVMCGTIDVAIAGGVENMSRVPMGSDGSAEEPFSPRLLERFEIVWQGLSAERIAGQWKLGREELDALSLRSHQRAVRAMDEGRFAGEIVPVEAVDAAGVTAVVTEDGTPRRDTSAEKLAALPPVFDPEGVITAGNSSQICDGASAALITTPARADTLGLRPRARFVSFGLAGVDPVLMLHGNPLAVEKALRGAGLTLDQIDVIEINEAFAAVVAQTARDLGLEDRWDDVNPNGSGISLGHPLGATGTRILATLLGELDRREARYGLATMCIGWGMAICGVVERIH
jgi:acetyl-CoA acetyltransferase family protein